MTDPEQSTYLAVAASLLLEDTRLISHPAVGGRAPKAHAASAHGPQTFAGAFRDQPPLEFRDSSQDRHLKPSGRVVGRSVDSLRSADQRNTGSLKLSDSQSQMRQASPESVELHDRHPCEPTISSMLHH
jgi:hypothetical protein